MFILDFNKLKENKEKLDKENNDKFVALSKYFIQGELYINTIATPAYFSIKNLLNKECSWLTINYDLNNIQIPLLFISILTGSIYKPPAIPLQINFFSQNSVCLHFIKNYNSVYIPIQPGHESSIFLPFYYNNE